MRPPASAATRKSLHVGEDVYRDRPLSIHVPPYLHSVATNQAGAVCGTILWESKRTKSWSDTGSRRCAQDQRAAKADIAVIVSRAMQKGVKPTERAPDTAGVTS